MDESLVWKIKDHEKKRLLELKKKYQEKEYQEIIDYLVYNYDKIINKTVFEVEKDKKIVLFNLLQNTELYKVKAGLDLVFRYRDILVLNKKNIY